MENFDMYIVPECYVATNFVETILKTGKAPTKGVNHQKGCNMVAKTIKDTLGDSFAIGVIDDDKRKVAMLGECIEICATEHIRVLKQNDKPHYLFMIRPAMDRFILDAAKEQGVNPESFGYPTELKKFTKRTKDIDTKNDPNMTKLVKAICQNPEIAALQSALLYLKTTKYDADTDIVSEFFAELQHRQFPL